MSSRYEDETGNTYGRLIVIERAGTQNRKRLWLCRCECGGENVVTTGNLRNGGIRSCGCLRDETARSRVGALNPAWKGDEVAYLGAHYRVRQERGHADQQDCLCCDGKAEEWACTLTPRCPEARMDATGKEQGLAFSTDPGDYIPLCTPCHRRIDRYRTTIKNGGA